MVVAAAYTGSCIRVSSRGKRTDHVAVGHSDGQGVGGEVSQIGP